MNRLMLLALPILMLLISSCGRPPELKVNDAVVMLSPVDQNPSALYFTVHGGTQDVDLLRVSSRSAIRTEIHENVSDAKTGMLAMKPISRLSIPAESKVEFRRGGKHVMVWGINLPARRLEKMEFIFTFSNADRIIVSAPVEKIAASEGEHANH